MACVAGSLLLLSSCNPQTAPAPGGKGGRKGGEIPVVVVKSTTKDMPIDPDVIGNVEASSTVSIKPQVSGELKAAFFKEGEFVKAGDPLGRCMQQECTIRKPTLNAVEYNCSLPIPGLEKRRFGYLL